jgi:hypothetical protein
MPITSPIINAPASLRSELITISPESVIIIIGIRILRRQDSLCTVTQLATGSPR